MLNTDSYRIPSILGLLVSVRNLDEARIAARHDIDVLDWKEPVHGPLGFVGFEALERALDSPMLDNIPMSVALGELGETPAQARPEILSRFQYAKFGHAGQASNKYWYRTWKTQLDRTGIPNPVAVAYADFGVCGAPDPEQVIDVGDQLGCRFFLIDTYTKTPRSNLFSYANDQQIRYWLEMASQRGMKTALAGSLSKQDLVALHQLQPNLVGVRGAVCGAGRQSSLDENRLADFAQTIRVVNASSGLQPDRS